MRHAFLITAYKNPRHLLRMMDLFDDRFDFYIHIDARSSIPPDDARRLEGHPRCRLVSRRYVNRWGGVNHLMAMLLLAKTAMETREYDYLHVRSGQCYPVKTADAIDRFFESRRGTEFVDSFPLPNTELWGEEGGYDRFRIFQTQTDLDAKDPRVERWTRILDKVQKKLGIRRKLPAGFPAVWGGTQWVSYTRELWMSILEQWRAHPSWYRFFRFAFCAEEMVLPSLAHAFTKNVDVRPINHVDWTFRNGSRPANLDDTDFDRIRDAGVLFARKVEYPLSQGLLDRIDRELLGR